MGSYQLGQFKTWTRSKLDDTSFDDNALTEYANEVNREICNSPSVWPFMEATATLTTANGSSALSGIPANLQVAVNLEITAPTANAAFLDFMPAKEFYQRYPAPATLTAAAPSVWTTAGSSYLVGPAPANATYTILMNFIKSPTATVSDSSTLDVPDDFAEVVVLGMYARALEHNDQPDYAKDQYGRFNRLLADMKQRYGLRQFGQIPVMQNRRTLLRGR